MTADTPAAPADPPVGAPPVSTRPLYWSIRRELWESRSVHLAPLAVFGLVLLAMLAGLFALPGRLTAALDPAQQHLAALRPFRTAPAPIMAATFIVGM